MLKVLTIEIAATWMAGLALVSVYEGVTDDDRIQAYCVCGSVAGSFAYILKQKIYEQQGVVAVFLANALIAGIFSPFLCDYLPALDIKIGFRSCVALSGSIGLLAPWILSSVIPILGKKVLSGLKSANPRTVIARVLNLKDRSDGKL